jgi:catechol-2,3-dioxygenase
MQSVAFTVEPGSLDELRKRLGAAGHPEVDGPARRGDGLWVADPDGLLVGFVEGAPAPPRDFPHVARNVDGAVERVDDARWLQLGPPRPRRLGHVIKFSQDLGRSERFYLGVLGLKLSDRVEGLLSFWNHGNGGDHHIFGAIQSSHPGLHHASFEVADIDEIGMGAQNMAQRGHQNQWGIGRHTFGSNLFDYIQDPWGSWVEYFSDIDIITCNWEGRTWEAPPAAWAPALPEEFLLNQEPVELHTAV